MLRNQSIGTSSTGAGAGRPARPHDTVTAPVPETNIHRTSRCCRARVRPRQDHPAVLSLPQLRLKPQHFAGLPAILPLELAAAKPRGTFIAGTRPARRGGGQ